MQSEYSAAGTDFGEEENARRNRKRADMVERGIDLALGCGFASANASCRRIPTASTYWRVFCAGGWIATAK